MAEFKLGVVTLRHIINHNLGQILFLNGINLDLFTPDIQAQLRTEFSSPYFFIVSNLTKKNISSLKIQPVNDTYDRIIGPEVFISKVLCDMHNTFIGIVGPVKDGPDWKTMVYSCVQLYRLLNMYIYFY